MSKSDIRTSRVFVTQEMDRLNYLPAEKYGEVIFITRNEFSAVRSSLSNVDLINTMHALLHDFDPDIDYVVFSGSPTVAAAVFAILGSRFSLFTVLRWSNRDNFYSPITIDIRDKA